jgi:glycerol kinase
MADTETAPTLLAIDQGTTSSRAILFSSSGEILALRQKELPQHFPHKGLVEQNPRDIWNDTLWACRAAMDDAPAAAANIAALGITNQRETTILWDRRTGEPVYNAIVWQDRRTAELCERLRAQGAEKTVQEKTGLLLDPYFSATKIAWLLENVAGARERAERGELAFGTVDTWLLWNLTAGKTHATDATNASRTLLFNIRTQEWDDELLALFNIPRSLLPDVRDNAADFGTTAASLLSRPLQIGGVAGDQQAALIGQACFTQGMVKSTYGTGCFALMNAGAEFRVSQNRLLTTIAYRFNGETAYAIEGAIFIAGAAIQWLRDGLGAIATAAETEARAARVPDSNGVWFLPAFTGLGAPYWDPNARAAIMGLTRESNADHIIRAALEAQAYQTQDLMEAMQADTGSRPALIRADGGLTANTLVCQWIADMTGTPVELPAVIETTAWGAACCAALHAGIFTSPADIAAVWTRARRYDPQIPEAEAAARHKEWKQAISRILTN